MFFPSFTLWPVLHGCESVPKMLPLPSPSLFQKTLDEMGLGKGEQLQNAIITKIKRKDHTYTLSIQHIPQKDILYVSINNYLWIDQSQSPSATAFTLTQIATLNYQVVGGKFQLNPQNGAITLGSETYVVNGIDIDNLKLCINGLINIADENREYLQYALKIKP